MNEYEIGILDYIWNHLHNFVCDVFFPLITHLGDAGIFWIILALLFLVFRKTRKIGIAVAFSLIVDLLLCNVILKPIVHRIRPYTLNPDMFEQIKLLIHANPPSDYSFPSGHTAASFAAAFALLFQKSKYSIPAIILASLIAFSRLYLYIHFPTDVLGGIAIGVLAGFVGSLLCNLLSGYIKRKKGIDL